MPDLVIFNDFPAAWETYKMLEAFSDGWGGWKVRDVLGVPLAELPEPLTDDLVTIKMLAGIVRRQREKRERSMGDG